MDANKQAPAPQLPENIIVVVGPSGRGKSTAIRTLDPKKVYILNADRKRLPFKEAKLFTKTKIINSTNDLIKGMQEAAADKDVEVIIFDTLTFWLSTLYSESRQNNKGWDVINNYNAFIKDFFDFARKINKRMIILAHEETVKDGDGIAQKQVKVDGKVWPGVIEAQAEIVLYPVMQKKGEGQNEYFFQTQTDGVTPAKSPMGMFDSYLIPNDFKFVLEKVNEYYA